MAAGIKEGGATYGEIDLNCAYTLCSFYSIELYLSLPAGADE